MGMGAPMSDCTLLSTASSRGRVRTSQTALGSWDYVPSCFLSCSHLSHFSLLPTQASLWTPSQLCFVAESQASDELEVLLFLFHTLDLLL